MLTNVCFGDLWVKKGGPNFLGQLDLKKQK